MTVCSNKLARRLFLNNREKYIMGLLIDVYTTRPDNSVFGNPDCTNDGISSKFNTLLVENVEGPFTPEEYPEYPVVLLEKGPYDTARIVPVELIINKKWFMFGGNYAGTSDSRFNEAVEKMINVSNISIVKIFDRVE